MCQQSSIRTPNLPGNVDARLVGKAHARRQRRRLAVDEIDRLVDLHADAVAGAVRQAGQLVARAVAPAFVGAADRVIDAARGHADLGGCDRDLLAAMHLVPELALLRRRIGAEHEGARDVGLIAVDRAGAVHQHDVAALHDVRLVRAVRIGRCLADEDQAAVVAPTQLLVRGGDHRVDVGGRHALAGPFAGVAQRREHDRRWPPASARARLGDLIIRSARTTGLALTMRTLRQLLLQPVEDEDSGRSPRSRSAAAATFRSRRKSATSFSGSSSSFQVRISAGTDRLSATDGPLEEGRDDDRIAVGRDDRRRSAARDRHH